MGLVSSLLGVGGIASNLYSNYQNQENNDRNYQLALRQQDFAEKSFKQQMRFNNPVTQTQLLRSAGLNPALGASGMAGSISTGSSGGMPSNIPMQSLDISALNGLASNISLLDSQKEKNEADARSTNVLTETKLMMRDAELEKLLNDSNLSEEMRSYYQSQRHFTRKLLEYQGEKSEWENENLRLEAINKSLLNETQTLHNMYLPRMSEAQIKEIVSTSYLNLMAGKLHGENINKVKQETISELIRTGILGNEFYKSAPEGLKGQALFNAMKNHPQFKKFETALDLLFNRLNSLPISFSASIK